MTRTPSAILSAVPWRAYLLAALYFLFPIALGASNLVLLILLLLWLASWRHRETWTLMRHTPIVWWLAGLYLLVLLGLTYTSASPDWIILHLSKYARLLYAVALIGLAGFLIARRLHLPLSLQFAGDMIDNPIWMAERPLNRWLNPLGKWLIRRASTFRVVSTREREKLIQLGVEPERVWNIGWITDFERFLSADGSAIRARWLDNLIMPRSKRTSWNGTMATSKA